MKNILLSAAAFALLLTASCKKDDNNNGPSNGWVLNGTSYNTSTTTPFGGTIIATSTSPVGSLSFDFSSRPSTTGTYRISENSSASHVAITATTGSTAYYSTDNDNVDATVSISGGKIRVSFPSVWVKSNSNDSVKVSGNVIEL